jgi:hypothetical protein
MATTLQLRRGTTAEANAVTGAAGELFVDLTTKQLRLHDGTTSGGELLGNVTTEGTQTLTNKTLSTGSVWNGGAIGAEFGGTGATSLAANSVILGNGTSAVQTVAPGSSGNVLTSNGTTWTSVAAAPASGSVSVVASGNITAGQQVVMNSDGTCSIVNLVNSVEGSSPNNFGGTFNFTSVHICRVPGTNNVVLAAGSSAYNSIWLWGGTITPNASGPATIVWDPSNQNIVATAPTDIHLFYLSETDRLVVVHRTGVNTVVNILTVVKDAAPITFTRISTTFTFTPFTNASKTRVAHDGLSNFVIFNQNNTSGYSALGVKVRKDGYTYDATVSIPATSGGNFDIVYLGNNDATADIYAAIYTNSTNVILEYFSLARFGQVSLVRPSSVTTLTTTATAPLNQLKAYYSSIRKTVMCFYFNTSNLQVIEASILCGGLRNAPINLVTGLDTNNFDKNLNIAVDPVYGNIILTRGNEFSFSIVSYRISELATTLSVTNTLTHTAIQSSRSGEAIYMSDLKQFVYAACNSNYINNDKIAVNAIFMPISNLSDANYIGIAANTVTSGNSVTVQLPGAVNNSQTGLTAGLKYFITPGGTLATTKQLPEVVAGVALSSTSMLVK